MDKLIKCKKCKGTGEISDLIWTLDSRKERFVPLVTPCRVCRGRGQLRVPILKRLSVFENKEIKHDRVPE